MSARAEAFSSIPATEIPLCSCIGVGVRESARTFIGNTAIFVRRRQHEQSFTLKQSLHVAVALEPPPMCARNAESGGATRPIGSQRKSGGRPAM